MPQVELINKEEAYRRSLKLKDVAFAIASASQTLPGYSNAPECIRYVALALLASELKTGEVCVFIDGGPAYQVTDFTIKDGHYVTGKICGSHIEKVFLRNLLCASNAQTGISKDMVTTRQPVLTSLWVKTVHSTNLPHPRRFCHPIQYTGGA